MRLEKFWLYETKTYFYLVGFDDQESRFRLLKINRSIARPKDLSEIIMEDPLVYDAQEIADILNMINEGNRQSGGIVKICTAFGIVGFVRFLNGFYLTLITQRKEVGCIAGNFIYSIKATEMFPIRPKEEKESNTFRTLWKKLNKKLNQTTSEIAENRYMGLFQFVDMTKDFFFSYSYDLTRSLQHNYIHSTASTSSSPLEMFEWNNYQIHELREVIGSDESAQWTLPIIHGSYQQKRFSLFGRAVDLVLVARRSRHYAGTRYLKRGLNVHGKVANDCEVEQILQCDGGAEVLFTSYVQMRGSIPTYWHQETSVTMPKPPILLNRVDPDYLATQEHFADLFRRYGAPLIVLDLVKQHEKRPRESIVGREFRQAVEVLNESIPMDRKIRYIALDYSKITSISKGKLSKAKTKNSGFLGYGGKDKERAMAVVGDEWALMEKSLVKDQSSSGSVAGKSKPDISLTNLDEARKDFQSTVVPGSFSAKSGTGLPVGYDSIAEINAVESKIDVLRELEDVAHLTIFETGFFCSSLQYLERVKDCIPQTTYEKAKRDKILFQNGVLRTNCIDCLDRTNGGQFAVAMRFLLVSLQALGISSPHLLSLDLSKDPLLLSLMEMYGEMGDKIALQYGGSEAHKKVFAGKSVQTHSSSKQSELLTSIKRYYSNAFTDMVKQDAMNLFLGCFVPNESSIPLWDLESDYYLHNLDLHPKAPDVYHVLYREIIHDSESIRDVTFKSRVESAVKKSISDFARMKDSDNQTLGRTASGDSLGGEKISSNNISSNSDSSNVDSGKLGLKIEAGKLMKRYYLKNLALEKAMGKLKNKGGLTNSLIRSLARLERRKMMRILVSRKIAFASEGWWLTPLMEYLDILKMWNGQQRFTNQSGKDCLKGNSSSIDYFQRFHQPYKLTEFDNLLGLEFLNPHDAVELPGDLSGKRKNLRISIDLEKDEATNSPVVTTLDTKDIEVADSSVLPYGLSSLFSFYPTLASTIYPGDSAVDNGSATPVKPSEQNEHPFGVLEDEKNYSPNQQGGFQITKYVREIGIKARTLVGGFLRKEESILTPSHGQRRTRTISGEASAGLRRNSEISTLRHIIPKSSMSLYRKYRDCFENNLLLTIEKDSRFIEEEYNSLLKDMRVNVDDVRGMENLAAESYVTAIMNCGVFQGLAQSSSAVLAYGFLFSSIVNVEAELEFFGNYVDQKASVSRDAGFASHMNELNPTMQALSSMKKTSLILSNEVQDRIVRSISRSKVAYGIEVELKKNVNNYIFQQYTYNKEISLDRLSRRISPYTPERTILEYSSQFDYDLLASDFKTVTYIASSSPGYTSFRDLTSLQQKLDHVSKDFEMRRNTQLNEAITERQDIQYIPPAQSSLDGLNGTSRSITEQLGLRLEGLIEDLKAQEDWTSFGSVGYPAFPYNSPSDEKQYESEYDGFINLAPDLYSKMANPHLQLNEIGVLRFKQALHTV